MKHKTRTHTTAASLSTEAGLVRTHLLVVPLGGAFWIMKYHMHLWYSKNGGVLSLAIVSVVMPQFLTISVVIVSPSASLSSPTRTELTILVRV